MHLGLWSFLSRAAQESNPEFPAVSGDDRRHGGSRCRVEAKGTSARREGTNVPTPREPQDPRYIHAHKVERRFGTDVLSGGQATPPGGRQLPGRMSVLTSSPNYPGDLGAEVVLSDGTRCSVRPIRPDDAERLIEFHQLLSQRSTYLRFFTVHPTLSAKEVERFTTVDYQDRLALVVEAHGKLIAVGRFDRLVGTPDAEVAFVVADNFQHHGLGSLLLDELPRAARDRGIKTFLAETLFENKAMLDVFHHSGFDVSTRVEYGTVWLRFDIAPTESYRVALAARDEMRQISRGPLNGPIEASHKC